MQIRLLEDCAEICAASAKYLLRQSPFAKSMVKKCAEICEVCGRECARFPPRTPHTDKITNIIHIILI